MNLVVDRYECMRSCARRAVSTFLILRQHALSYEALEQAPIFLVTAPSVNSVKHQLDSICICNLLHPSLFSIPSLQLPHINILPLWLLCFQSCLSGPVMVSSWRKLKIQHPSFMFIVHHAHASSCPFLIISPAILSFVEA